MKEKYFLASKGLYPECMYFSKEEAFLSGLEYIDSFNIRGKKVKSYKRVENSSNNTASESPYTYTTDF